MKPRIVVVVLACFTGIAVAHEAASSRPTRLLNFQALKAQRTQQIKPLVQTLLIENYEVNPAVQRRLDELGKSNPQGEAEQRAILEEMDEQLDALVRFVETMQIEFEADGEHGFNGPGEIRLVDGVVRQVPVIVRNTTDSVQRMHWATHEKGEVLVPAFGRSRFFVPMLAGKGDEKISFGFSAQSNSVTFPIPITVVPAGQVNVRVVDERGEPMPVRLYVTGSDSGFYVPSSAIKRLTAMGDRYTYAPGRFSLKLPPGEAKIELSRGPDYPIQTLDTQVLAGKESNLDVQLKRFVGMPARGWYSGDGHIHMSYGGNLAVGPEDSILMLQAEDLNAGNMVVANIWGNDVQDRIHFTGSLHRLSTPLYQMRWNEEYRNNFWGHLILYGQSELTDPIYSGFTGTPHPFDWPMNADVADQVLAQGGFVTGAHPFWNRNEHAVDVALGKLGGIETMGYGAMWASGIDILHALWNCGFRTVATAGTDSFLNVVQGDPLGGARCYAKVDGGFTYDAWLDAVRSGRTFVTTGPLMFLQVNGEIPGGSVKGEGGKEVAVIARAVSQWTLTELKIFYNGRVMINARPDEGNPNEIVIDQKIRVEDSGWIAAQAKGPHNRFIFGGGLFKRHPQVAHTSPVWVEVSDRPMPPTPDAEKFVQWMDNLADRVREEAKFGNDSQRRYALEMIAKARVKYQAIAALRVDSD